MAKRSALFTLLALACVGVLMGVAFPRSALAAGAPTARASHILVKTEAEADDLFDKLRGATDLKAQFAAYAKEFSSCPSRRNGGDLGSFGRGAMVAPFDKVVFEKPKGVVHKVQTRFGWHLVLTTEREGVDEAVISAHDQTDEL